MPGLKLKILFSLNSHRGLKLFHNRGSSFKFFSAPGLRLRQKLQPTAAPNILQIVSGRFVSIQVQVQARHCAPKCGLSPEVFNDKARDGLGNHAQIETVPEGLMYQNAMAERASQNDLC